MACDPGWGGPPAWLGSAPADAPVDAGLAEELRFGLVGVRRGAEVMAYDTIVGGGVNSATLHFAPTSRRFHAGELVLIDAGAQYRGYASDITWTCPVGGRFDPVQQELHSVVHAAQQAAIAQCRAGMEWRDVHLTAALVIAEGLVACGILRGEPASLVQVWGCVVVLCARHRSPPSLGVRDAGGTPLPERRDCPKPYPNLRIDLPLESGMLDFGASALRTTPLISYEVITGDVPLLG